MEDFTWWLRLWLVGSVVSAGLGLWETWKDAWWKDHPARMCGFIVIVALAGPIMVGIAVFNALFPRGRHEENH